MIVRRSCYDRGADRGSTPQNTEVWMSMLGLRVGPFEIVERVRVPEPGEWFRARRAGMTRRQPNEVLLRMLPPDASVEARAALQRSRHGG